MTRPHSISLSNHVLARLLTGLGLVGACTVADKADYTFSDEPGGDDDETGGTAGTAGTAGSGKGGTAGKGGTSGEAGGGNGGTSGMAGEGGDGTGGGGGACDPNPCENGSCTGTGSTFTCDCDDGWQGVTCDEDIDECDPNPCLNGGTCNNLVGDFSCACLSSPPAFTGKRCELPRFQPIGMGPSGTARAVSADGTMVLGHFLDPQGYYRPFHWTFGSGGRPLPIPSILRPDVNVTTYALSGDGDRWVGQVAASVGAAAPSPIGGTTASAGMFGTPPAAIAGAIFDTNGDGTVSVGYFTGDMMNPGVHALRWNAMGMPVPLMNPQMGSMYYAAGAVNRDGTVIAGTFRDLMNAVWLYSWVTEPGSTVPVMRPMPSTTVVDLAVHGLSNDGMVAAGTFWDNANANFAFITRGSRVEDISPMAGSVRAFSQAWDVSDDGQVIVGEANLSMMMAGQPSQAILWKNDGSWRPLLDILRENNALPPMGFNLTVAYGVSADGKVIVGQGVDAGGQSVGFIARLP